MKHAHQNGVNGPIHPYDEAYREMCWRPEEYDNIIALLMKHNPYCVDLDWAADTVNYCIDHAIENKDKRSFESIGTTGMCAAICSPDGILLYLTPGGNTESMGEDVRKQALQTLQDHKVTS